LCAHPVCPSRDNPNPSCEAREITKDSGRWGLYEWDQEYLIYEPADVQILVDLLTKKESHGESETQPAASA
jgi:hypothetical protein